MTVASVASSQVSHTAMGMSTDTSGVIKKLVNFEGGSLAQLPLVYSNRENRVKRTLSRNKKHYDRHP